MDTRVSWGRKKARAREKEREIEEDGPSFKPPTKNKIPFPIPCSVFLFFCLSLLLSARLRFSLDSFVFSPSGQTLFLDIHPQKCNDRLFPAVKLSTGAGCEVSREETISLVEVRRERGRERESAETVFPESKSYWHAI